MTESPNLSWYLSHNPYRPLTLPTPARQISPSYSPFCATPRSHTILWTGRLSSLSKCQMNHAEVHTWNSGSIWASTRVELFFRNVPELVVADDSQDHKPLNKGSAEGKIVIPCFFICYCCRRHPVRMFHDWFHSRNKLRQRSKFRQRLFTMRHKIRIQPPRPVTPIIHRKVDQTLLQDMRNEDLSVMERCLRYSKFSGV